MKLTATRHLVVWKYAGQHFPLEILGARHDASLLRRLGGWRLTVTVELLLQIAP